MPGASAPSSFGFSTSFGSAPAASGAASYFAPTYNAALPTPGAGANSSLYNPGAFTAGGFAPFSNLAGGGSSGSSGGGYQPTIGGTTGSNPFASTPTRQGAVRIGNYTFYNPGQPLNWTNYGPEGPSWDQIRRTLPGTLAYKGRGNNPFGTAPVASPVPTTVAPSAFDALGGDGSSQYISQLIASIQGQAPQTLGWFEAGTRPAQLFGLPY